MKKLLKKGLLLMLAAGLVVGCSQGNSNTSEAQGKPDKIRLDFAYYSPLSLFIKEKGWAEEAFAQEGIEVTWVLSQGSNKALEFLNSNSVDFGSAAGAAALISKSKGAPIEGVYISSKPEWTALVTAEKSPIRSVKDLVGKKIAATVGTDPHIFLLRALNEAGLTGKDVEIVNLQHNDGATALTTGQVDAWAGLDPHMARVEIENKANLFYRNVEFNTYSFLLVRNDFAQKYPDYVQKVIEIYEKARAWALANPEEATAILAKEAKLSPEVAKRQMERNDFTQPVPGEVQKITILEAGKVLQGNQIIKPDADLGKLVDELIQPSYAQKVVK
jgi:sulfonate transport system substrate-binding protein